MDVVGIALCYRSSNVIVVAQRVQVVIENARKYLCKNVANLQDPYDLALVSYAMSLVDKKCSTTEDELLQRLFNLMTADGKL